MLCVVVLLRLQLNFWISFKGESVVDLIIYVAQLWLVGMWLVGRITCDGDSPLDLYFLTTSNHESMVIISNIVNLCWNCGSLVSKLLTNIYYDPLLPSHFTNEEIITSQQFALDVLNLDSFVILSFEPKRVLTVCRVIFGMHLIIELIVFLAVCTKQVWNLRA